MLLTRTLSTLALALAAALPLWLPNTALAQSGHQQADLGVTGFGVTPLDQLRPGEVLVFKLDGTPDGRVSVQISGASGTLQLNETNPGRYEGEYTIRTRDKLSANSPVTARLENNGRSVTATLGQSLQAGSGLGPAAGGPISSFHVSAPAQVQPGDELVFALHGQPGGQASASVQGIAQRIALAEVRPGIYEAAYVVRRKDKLRGNLVADGRLVVNHRETTVRHDTGHHGAQGGGQAAATCNQCGSVTAVNLVTVKDDHPNVLGTIAGGVLGGVLGNQVGGGSGRDLATIAGAVGGAYAGNRVENNMNRKQVHRVSVRLDNGTTRSFDYAQDPGLKSGARIKVVDNALERL